MWLNVVAQYVSEKVNSCIDKGEFPIDLKHADVVRVHYKKVKTDKTNCRSMSILLHFAKVYEKPMYKQIYQHFETLFSSTQCKYW